MIGVRRCRLLQRFVEGFPRRTWTDWLPRESASRMRHASDAVCSPTRYGVLTGRYCFRSRLKAGVLPPWGAPLIERNRLTVPELLRRHGYATACIGKWHLGWTWPTRNGKPPLGRDGQGNIDFTQRIANGPTALGFDTYFGVDLPNYPPYCFIENDRTVGIPSVPAPMERGGYQPTRTHGARLEAHQHHAGTDAARGRLH